MSQLFYFDFATQKYLLFDWITTRPLHKWREEKGREEDKKWKKERDLV
jgi:hypothetical protein